MIAGRYSDKQAAAASNFVGRQNRNTSVLIPEVRRIFDGLLGSAGH
jgi:hypothetical protein